MSNLPSRGHINERIGGLGAGKLIDEWAIAGAYGLGELKTEAEWRDTIDYEAAARWTHAEMVLRGPTDLTWEAAYPEEQADHLFLALGAISAALGDDKTVEELRAAAFGMVTE